MSDTQKDYDDSYSDQFAIDNLDDTNDNETTRQTSDSKDFKTLQAEINALKEQNAQLLTQFAKSAQPAYQPPVQQNKASQELDDATLEQFGKNPKALLQFVNKQIESGMTSIQKQTLKSQFDQKVYEDFPVIKTNKKFEENVISQMKELVNNGEYDAQHPMLIYRAAQLTAAKMGNSSDSHKSVSRETSLSPSNQRGVTKSSGVKDNDPRLAFAVAAGIKDPKKLAKFKKDLEAHYGSTEEHLAKRGNLSKNRGRTIGGR